MGWEGAIPVHYQTLPVPIFSLFPGPRAYPRPNEGNFMEYDEVSEIGSRIDLNMTPELTRINPPDRVPRLVPRWPQTPHIPTSGNPMLRIGLI